MTLREFHNALRILRGVDRDELVDGGIHLRAAEWYSFKENPFLFFIQADDPTAEALWKIIEILQPKDGK